jgi:cellulose biosynthesis protein BcsQ
MRIAVCGTKGGSGKSTLAGLLALCLADAGRKVCAIDQDPQATLTTWLRSVGGKPAPWVKGEKEFKELERTWTCVGEWGKDGSDSDAIWINDFPPASPEPLLKMIDRINPSEWYKPFSEMQGHKRVDIYDVLLIPCRPALADIWSIRSFLEKLDGYKGKVRLVMNALDNSSISKAGSIDTLLKGIKTPRTKATLSRRACYSYAMAGGWPALDEKAKSEVLSLALEIMK